MTEALAAAYGGVSDRLERAIALPRAAYADPAVFQAEVEKVLRAGWLPVARANALANPGDYRCVEAAGVPLVVTRDFAGEIHVLSSICRHRGFPVAEGSGNARSFTCPYHLWRYGLDGRLAAVPGMERSAIFERDACALPRIRHGQWAGWVFANIDGAAEDLAPQLAALDARLARYDPAAMVTVDVRDYDSPWNWKVMVENFMESYHHIGPHAGTLQQSNPGLNTFVADTGEAYTVLENPGADDAHPPFMVGTVFPATLISFGDGPRPFGVWYELDAIEACRFRLRIHLLAAPALAADAEFVATMRQLLEVIHAEDIPACERVQAGVTSPLYTPGPLSHLEGCLWRFHRHIARRLGVAAES